MPPRQIRARMCGVAAAPGITVTVTSLSQDALHMMIDAIKRRSGIPEDTHRVYYHGESASKCNPMYLDVLVHQIPHFQGEILNIYLHPFRIAKQIHEPMPQDPAHAHTHLTTPPQLENLGAIQQLTVDLRTIVHAHQSDVVNRRNPARVILPELPVSEPIDAEQLRRNTSTIPEPDQRGRRLWAVAHMVGLPTKPTTSRSMNTDAQQEESRQPGSSDPRKQLRNASQPANNNEGEKEDADRIGQRLISQAADSAPGSAMRQSDQTNIGDGEEIELPADRGEVYDVQAAGRRRRAAMQTAKRKEEEEAKSKKPPVRTKLEWEHGPRREGRRSSSSASSEIVVDTTGK